MRRGASTVRRVLLACPGLVILALSITLSCKASAQDFWEGGAHRLVLGGDACHVRNPTTENAASLRRTDGSLENTSEKLSATVSCPIPMIYEPVFLGDGFSSVTTQADVVVKVFFLNSQSSGEQQFNCRYRVMQQDGEDVEVYDFYGRSKVIGSGSVGMITIDGSFSEAVETDVNSYQINRPIVTCGLPPNSSLLHLLVDIAYDYEFGI